MKKNKWIKYIIIGFVLLLLLLIVFLVGRVSEEVDIKYDVRGSVRGIWKIDTYKVFENGELKETIENYNQVNLTFSENNVEFCYNIDEKWDCFSHNYWIEDGVLTIYMFESGKMETNFNYTLTDSVFELKDGDDKNYTVSTFSRIG